MDTPKPPTTAKPITLWHYGALLAVVVCGILGVLMAIRLLNPEVAEDSEEARADARSNDEAIAKEHILNTMKYRDAVFVDHFGPNDAKGQLGLTWPRVKDTDKQGKAKGMPVTAVRVHWKYYRINQFSRAFDFIYYIHDGKVVGAEYNPWGGQWKNQLPHADYVAEPPGYKDVQ